MKARSSRVSEVMSEKMSTVSAEVLLGSPLGVGVLEVVEEPEELQEDLGRLTPLDLARGWRRSRLRSRGW